MNVFLHHQSSQGGSIYKFIKFSVANYFLVSTVEASLMYCSLGAGPLHRSCTNVVYFPGQTAHLDSGYQIFSS